MRKDERDVLEVLKSEFEFLKKGGYSTGALWGPRCVFEDSPTCVNYARRDDPIPCTDCVLMHFVPTERRSEKIPCRHIPLDASGQTLDSLYRFSNQEEVEEAVRNWLLATIERLEEERLHREDNPRLVPSGEARNGVPLYGKLHPKCANPACPAAFHWLGGGKFFRFRPDEDFLTRSQPKGDSPTGHQGVKHYWLCEHCSHVFTLVYEEEDGVVLKARWSELPVAKAKGEGR